VGFRQEAYFVEDFFYNGQYRNSIHYGMLESELRLRADLPETAGPTVDRA
jgi:RimJ/RimL family protein N-acetyltransferase